MTYGKHWDFERNAYELTVVENSSVGPFRMGGWEARRICRPKFGKD